MDKSFVFGIINTKTASFLIKAFYAFAANKLERLINLDYVVF